MNRLIGIRHRVKLTAEGEERPTVLFLFVPEANATETLEMKTELDELDFVLGRFPTDFRKISYDNDDLSKFLAHHIKWRTIRQDENPEDFPEAFVREGDSGKMEVAIKVPKTFDGLKAGDVVLRSLGGSGDMLDYAVGERGQEIGARLCRVPPHVVAKTREGDDKDVDAELLVKMYQDSPNLFYEFRPRDASLILVRERLRLRTDAMKVRIACEQRLRQRMIGAMFRSLSQEGDLTKAFEAIKANDKIFQAVLADEARSDRELKAAVEATDVFQGIFADIKGVGPAIAGRVIAAIVDIRRFETKARLKAFCGVGVRPDGSFLRRRKQETANWHPDARQALYLLADQFNRRKDTPWGMILLHYKRTLRAKYPKMLLAKGDGNSELFRLAQRVFRDFKLAVDPGDFNLETLEGFGEYLDCGIAEIRSVYPELEVPEGILKGRENLKKQSNTGTITLYSNGHIHKMALWRVVTKFIEWLHCEWWRLEDNPEGFVCLPPNVLKFADPAGYQKWSKEATEKDPELKKILEDASNEANGHLAA